jgi:uncharacterized protein YabN with tetrapyrrole methylase and pyrophosphatase domain
VSEETLRAIERLDQITRTLRRECPWDRAQDARSIVPHTVEEAYELADAARRDATDEVHDELGDVLFQVFFLSLLLEERGLGDLGSVADGCSDKLIRRHPHVYGDGGSDPVSAGEVVAQWEEIKQEVERGGEGDPFASIPETLPSLTYARKILRRTDPTLGSEGVEDSERDEAEERIGLALLDLVREARKAGVDPELALRAECDKLRADATGSAGD